MKKHHAPNVQKYLILLQYKKNIIQYKKNKYIWHHTKTTDFLWGSVGYECKCSYGVVATMKVNRLQPIGLCQRDILRQPKPPPR